jgi:hypothetical protein
MKKLLLILLLFTYMAITPQTVTYQADNSVINNPEKGFFHYTSTGSSGGYNLLSQATLEGYRTNENITVIQRQFFLRDFITGIPITSTYLTNMQTDFNRIRAAGAKVIVRFTYTSSSATVYQPNKQQMLFHMKQLVNVLNVNKDVIISIQLGFIGRYGEWYYTGSAEFGDGNFTILTNTQWNNRKEIVDYALNNFPKEIPLQLRYIYAKQRMYGNTYIGRIGFYNDSFLGTWGDSGTFIVSSSTASPSPADVTYWENNTINNPVTGETNMVNAPRTDCTNALVEMNKFNWSLINKDYLVTNITNWQTGGCFTTMQKSLGYDFRLNTANISASGLLTINIGNYGYANLFKVRRAIIVCKNIATNVNYSYVIETNLRALTTTSRTMSMNLATLGLPIGQYKILLNLPDPNAALATNPKYSIRCSNLNTWTAEGFNDLLLTYTVAGVGIVSNQISTTDGAVLEAKIYNTSGTVVSRKVDVSDLPNGIYIVKAKTSQGNSIIQKIRIQR